MSQELQQQLITPVFRMSYPNLLKAKPYMENGVAKGAPRYSLQMVFKPEDLGKFKAWDGEKGEFVDMSLPHVLANLAKGMWPDMNVKEAVKHDGLHWPIKDALAEAERRSKGRELSEVIREAMAGNKLISTDTLETMPPHLYYSDKGQRKEIARGTTDGDAMIARMFTGGNYGYAEVKVKVGTAGTNKYLKLYLNSVRYVREGEKFGSEGLMARYDGVSGGEANTDPTEGMDDEIPF